ncbi:MAG: glycosyltransferase family 4 protein [Gemmataceae bacterium]|nr:glycosyltransferase family 4 protein [Gemmataceae bacterium]
MPRLLIAATIVDTLQSFLAPFAEHFRAQGYRVDGLARETERNGECARSFDRLWNADWSRNPLKLGNFLGTPKRIRELVERERYDIVHVHTPVAAFLTRYALRKMRAAGRVRVIYTAHGFHFYKGGPAVQGTIYRTLERLAGPWTDRLVVINREDEDAAIRFGFLPREHVRYMPGIGVDTSKYAATQVDAVQLEATRNELGLTADSVLFLMIAEFNPGKRHRDALRAFAQCGCPNAVLALAGDGMLKPQMQQLAAELGIADRVRFLGFRRDIPTLVRLSRAVMLPSEREGLPRSLMESLSLGVPAIGCSIRGVADLLGDGRGLLVPVGDPAALAAAIRRLAEHPDEAAAMGERGREAMKSYDLREIIRMHEELYDEVLGTRTGDRAMVDAASR